MKKANIKDMTNGWMVGDFSPTVWKTSQVEVAHHFHAKGSPTVDHYHKESTEINYVMSGLMRVNDCLFESGDIFILEPNEVSKAQFLADTNLIVIRTQSIPGDKYSV